MVTRGKKKSKSKDPPSPLDEDSDGDKTPTKNNLKETEVDDSTIHSDISNTNEIEADDTIDNPHSAQALLNNSLNPPDHVAKHDQLMAAAADKAAKRRDEAIKKRESKRKALAEAANKKAASKSTAVEIDDDSSSSSSGSSQGSSSSSDNEYGKKPKAKKSSRTTKNSQKLQKNTYAILQSGNATKSNSGSGLSKAAKKRQKKIARPFKTFFCAKIKVQSSANSMDELHKKTKKWYDYFRQADNTAIIYPFKDDKPTTALSSPENIPDSLAPFRNYFHQANPRSIDGHVWVNVFIGHTEPVHDILKEMGNYKNDTDTFTYAKKLQTRYVAKEYFLLWSTDFIDVSTLTQEVHTRISQITKKKYQFAFAWNEIKGLDGKKYLSEKKDRWRRDALSALHIQVPEGDKDEN